MRTEDRALARRQLDKRFAALRNTQSLTRPPRGWIRAVREALGMTTRQLGARMGVSQPRVVNIEQGEVSGSITLATLQRAANALDCQLAYALLPRRPLQELIEDRARSRARSMLQATAHSMALENQRADEESEHAQFELLVKELIERSGSAHWEEE